MPTAQKHVLLPKAVSIGGFEYSHKMLINHFLDTAKLFQTRNGSRQGNKILDAIEAAEKTESWFYSLDGDTWKLLNEVAESDDTELPVLTQQHTDLSGKPVGEPSVVKIGTVRYISLIDPISQATIEPPERPVAEAAGQSTEAAPALAS